MDYTKQIFEMLDIAPNEEFYLSNRGSIKFKINKDLTVLSTYMGEQRVSDIQINNILNGVHRIIKISKPTAKEQLAIDYGKACGFKWMAKDKDGLAFYYKEKPQQSFHGWWSNVSNIACYRCLIPISFLHWKDEEPYYIGEEDD